MKTIMKLIVLALTLSSAAQAAESRILIATVDAPAKNGTQRIADARTAQAYTEETLRVLNCKYHSLKLLSDRGDGYFLFEAQSNNCADASTGYNRATGSSDTTCPDGFRKVSPRTHFKRLNDSSGYICLLSKK